MLRLGQAILLFVDEEDTMLAIVETDLVTEFSDLFRQLTCAEAIEAAKGGGYIGQKLWHEHTSCCFSCYVLQLEMTSVFAQAQD